VPNTQANPGRDRFEVVLAWKQASEVHELTLSSISRSQDYMTLLHFLLLHSFIKCNGPAEHLSAAEAGGPRYLIKIVS
jgi:hypothetical protein